MIRYGSAKNPIAPAAEDERRDGDERIRRVDAATLEKPGEDAAELPAAERPLVEVVHVGLAPAAGEEADHGDQHERSADHDRLRDLDRADDHSAHSRSCPDQQVDDAGDDAAEDDRGELVPDEERDPGQRRVPVVVERRVDDCCDRKQQQKEHPAPARSTNDAPRSYPRCAP